ncbi:Acyl carrier protein [Streptomyces griseus subsp. griseus]
MSTITSDRRSAIKEIVCDILELDEGDVTETSLFIDDHGADSLRAIEILASLEKEFGITIDQSELRPDDQPGGGLQGGRRGARPLTAPALSISRLKD